MSGRSRQHGGPSSGHSSSQRRRIVSSSSSSHIGISECVQDLNKCSKTIEKVFKWFGDAAEQMMEVQDLCYDDYSEYLETMEKELVGVASIHNNIGNMIKSLEEFKETLLDPDLDAHDNMSDQFIEKLEKMNTDDPNTHPLLIAYKQSIVIPNDSSINDNDNTITMDEGEGFGMGRVERSTVCPITRVTMVEPVRNTVCGHTYSKEAISLHIRNVLRRKKGPSDVRCPVGGCPSTVSEETLEKDEDMERQLKREKRHQQQQGWNGAGPSGTGSAGSIEISF